MNEWIMEGGQYVPITCAILAVLTAAVLVIYGWAMSRI